VKKMQHCAWCGEELGIYNNFDNEPESCGKPECNREVYAMTRQGMREKCPVCHGQRKVDVFQIIEGERQEVGVTDCPACGIITRVKTIGEILEEVGSERGTNKRTYCTNATF
jgi:hypothetical protein